MTSLNTETLKEVMSAKKRNVVMTDEFKELIHVRVNEGVAIKEIVKELNEREDWGIPNKKNTYNYVYNYLQRQLKKLS